MPVEGRVGPALTGTHGQPAIAQSLGDSAPDPDYHALRRAGSAFFELNVPIVPIVTQLAAARHRLGILSNTCESHWEYCHDRFTILRDLFDVCTLSYEVGALKPAAEIFHAAADAAEVAPSEIFFVDDRPEHVAGARDVGFDAVQFTTPARLATELRRRGVDFNY